MKNDTPINDLLRSSDFSEKVKPYLGVSNPKFSFSELGRGFSKVAYKVTDKTSNKEFVVKEIRFRDQFTSGHYDDADNTNNTLTPQNARFEIKTIKEISKTRSQADHFPQHIALFAYVHPIEEYDEIVEKGRIVDLITAKALQKEGYGISYFIAEELVKGRAPTEAEVEKAAEIRRQGMQTHPRVWLTVDVDANDIVMRGDGRPAFIDVGNFKEFTLDEQKMYRQFLAEGRKK